MLHLDIPALSPTMMIDALYPRLRGTTATLQMVQAAVAASGSQYEANCRNGAFSTLPTTALPNGLSTKQARRLYIHLRDSPHGRAMYEFIRDCNGGHCAYCQVRTAETLDHYLERARIPLLCVYPANLVPSCMQCNSALRGASDKFHPYYEDVSQHAWLTAKLLKNGADVPGVAFLVRRASIPSKGTDKRVRTTMQTIGLSRRWGVENSYLVERALTMFQAVPEPSRRRQRLLDWRDDMRPNRPDNALLLSMSATPWFLTWNS